MALRSQTAIAAILMLAGVAAAQESFDAQHEHWRKSCHGTLTVDGDGVAFTEIREKPRKQPHAWRWPYHEIQQATLNRETVRVLTYEDSSNLKLGADREYTFRLASGQSFAGIRDRLRTHLDTRLIDAVPLEEHAAEWKIPAKLLRLTTGSHGVLEAGAEFVVFRTGESGRSRQWRWADIENVTSTGPYSLTLTTSERSRLHYGGRRDFQFQLKQPIDPEQVDALWRRIRHLHGPHVLDRYTTQENR